MLIATESWWEESWGILRLQGSRALFLNPQFTYEKTEWAKIMELYDTLYRLKPSPIVALNRAVALGNALGPEGALAELRKIPDSAKLKDYPFYPAAQREFHFLAGRPAEAAKHFEKAMKLARSRSETNFFEAAQKP